MTHPLIQLSDHAWQFPLNPDRSTVEPNVGVIIAADTTILVDGGNGPPHARRIRQALAGFGAPPVGAVIYTHHHWDHVFGALVFDAPTIASKGTHALLRERAALPWSYAYLDEQIHRNPVRQPVYAAMQRAVDSWREFRIVVPSLVFEHRLTVFRNNDVRIDLQHVGGRHAAESITVRVDDVLFLGDAFYPAVDASGSPVGGYDLGVLDAVLADESIRLYTDAHSGRLRSRDDLAALRATGEA